MPRQGFEQSSVRRNRSRIHHLQIEFAARCAHAEYFCFVPSISGGQNVYLAERPSRSNRNLLPKERGNVERHLPSLATGKALNAESSFCLRIGRAHHGA